MTKKRKFYFTYADNNEEEKHIIKKEFNEMLKEVFFKIGKTLNELMIPNLVILILIGFLLANENQKIKLIALILLLIIIPLYLFKLYKIGQNKKK